jgi:hypothetical protein
MDTGVFEAEKGTNMRCRLTSSGLLSSLEIRGAKHPTTKRTNNSKS